MDMDCIFEGRGGAYYQNKLLYVDDCLVVSKFHEEFLKSLKKYFMLKNESI